jgi:hypothetical protein
MSIGIFGNKCASLIHSFIDSLIHSLPSALPKKTAVRVMLIGRHATICQKKKTKEKEEKTK